MPREVFKSASVLAAFALAGCGGDAGPSASPSAARVEEAAETETTQRGPTVVMLGDSLTAGFGLAAEEALPAALERRLAEIGVSAVFVNAGVSGDTTGGGRDRYDFSVRGADADLVLVALGANDFLRGLAPEIAKENLAAIIEAAQADGAPVALIGLKPPTGGARAAAFAAIYPALAEAYGVPLFDAMLRSVRNKPALIQSDGLHPTAAGVEMIAEDLAPFVVRQVRALDAD